MTLTDCPESRAGEWNFHLFGIEVRVKFWFWFATLLFCGDMDTKSALVWVGVCFVSILLHEFGHVIAFRLFGTDAYAVLYGFGGLAVPDNGIQGTLAQFVVAMAGPIAGFLGAALVMSLAYIGGMHPHIVWNSFLPSISPWPEITTANVAHLRANYLWYVMVQDLLYVNFFWGLVNLLPVFPLDGGHAARAIFERRDHYNGKRTAYLVSAITGGMLVLAGVLARNLYLILLFGLLAAGSAQQFEATRRRFRPHFPRS
jgi:membrane-associated protease RseP (regulator of RpoE activity)